MTENSPLCTKEELTRRVQLFTHSDLDGAASVVMAFNAEHWSRDEVTYEICQYSGPKGIDIRVGEYLDKLEAEKEENVEHILLMTDIGPSKETCARIEQMEEWFEEIIILDHHKSTLWAGGEKYPWFHHSGNSACGAKMAWNRFVSADEKKQFVGLAKATDAYDRWVLDSENRERGENLNLLFKFLGFPKFVDEFSQNPDADFESNMQFVLPVIRAGQKRAVRRSIELQLNNSAKDSFFFDKAGRKVALLIADNDYVSQTGEQVLKDFPDVDYVAFILAAPGIMSLRSRNNGVDVAQIAEKFGGGGHSGAAGFPLEELRAAVLAVPAAKLDKLDDE